MSQIAEHERDEPDLRFPEFEGAWEGKQLADVANVFDGTHQTPKYTNNGIPFVSVENIGKITETDKYISKEDFEKNFNTKPQRNDILMTRITAGIIGNTEIVKNNNPLAYYVSLALIRIMLEIEVEFLNQQILNPIFKRELHKRIIHVAFPKKINLGEISKCRLAIPKEIKEQQKIASFLSAVDEKIAQLEEKKNLLEAYKKGCMQQLFSQALRFQDEDGNDFPDWEEKRLVSLSKEKLSNGVFNDPAKVGSGYRIINVKDMYTHGYISEHHLSRVNISKCEFEGNQVSYGDTFFTRSSLVKEGIAYSNVYLGSALDLTFDGHLIRLKLDTTQINPIFLNSLLKTNNLRRQLVARGKTGTMTTIAQDDIASIICFVPTLPEQQKIADFLSALDDKITHAATQLEQIKCFKKGLLQKMFV